MKSRFSAAAVLSVAATLLAGPAFASPFTLTAGTGPAGLTGNDLTGSISFNSGSTHLADGSVFIGPLNMTVTDTGVTPNVSVQQTIYCTDIFDPFQPGTSLYNLVSMDTQANVSATQLGLINALLSNAPAHPAMAGDSPASGAAIQALIWEILNETASGLDLGSGAFQAAIASDSSNFASDVALDIQELTSGDWKADPNAVVMDYVLEQTDPPQSGNQTFGFLAISHGGGATPAPEPASLGMLGLGLAALAMARRKRTSHR